MIGYPDSPRAWWLTRGMARISGVNLTRAVVDGWLNREELAEMLAVSVEMAGGPGAVYAAKAIAYFDELA